MQKTETKNVIPINVRPKSEREKVVMRLRLDEMDESIMQSGGKRGLAPACLAAIRAICSGKIHPSKLRGHWDTPLEIQEEKKK